MSKQRQFHFHNLSYLWTDTQPSTAFPTYWKRKTSCYFTAEAWLFLWGGYFLQQCCLHINVSCWRFLSQGITNKNRERNLIGASSGERKSVCPPCSQNVTEQNCGSLYSNSNMPSERNYSQSPIELLSATPTEIKTDAQSIGCTF